MINWLDRTLYPYRRVLIAADLVAIAAVVVWMIVR
jgi:hypothetical protein